MNYFFRQQGDHVFDWRKQWVIDNPLRRLIHPAERILDGLVKPGMTVVDTGCGTGFFTLALARMVGDTGRVIAVDLQAEALARVEEKAAIAEVSRIVETWKCEADDIGQLPKVDFGFSFYMAHEVPDIDHYFRRMFDCVKPGGAMLLAEPYLHVSKKNFGQELEAAARAGFTVHDGPGIRLSHRAILRKG